MMFPARLQIIVATGILRTFLLVAPLTMVKGIDYVQDVAPILSRYGCNSSSCHGKSEGQNGFKLSIFGTDAESDFASIVHQSRGRRIMPAVPDQSLLLQKATGGVPHEGGTRFERDSRPYNVVKAWLKAGAPFENEQAPKITNLIVEPARKILPIGSKEQLKVIVEFDTGEQKEVTWLAEFHSNDASLAEVDDQGMVKVGKVAGKTAVLARYSGRVATFELMTPQPGNFGETPKVPVLNFIDEHIDKQLSQLNLHPSALADDPTFLRRAYLDVAGRLPTLDEAREFFRSPNRTSLIDTLLESREYADLFTLLWSDLLRADTDALGHHDAYLYYRWIHHAISQNMPLDQLVKELITASGPLQTNPAGHFHLINKNPGDTASMAAQVFLGLRITCAECHQHPYDRWSQQDYHGFRAYFASVSTKTLQENQLALLANKPSTAKHPRTGATIPAHPLGENLPETPSIGDLRPDLAKWMTSSENPWFAKNMANRIWAKLMGRGLVEPIDDLRSTNPASHPELLNALAQYLIDSDYDAKALIRLITNSRTYQQASATSEANELDEKNFSRSLFRRLPAEVLLDAVSDVTGVPEKFVGTPQGYRAVQLWDSRIDHYFLKLFGRPARATPCECERSSGATISQALHLMNSPAIEAKLSHAGGRMALLNEKYPNDPELVDELYLTCFSRYPNREEKKHAVQYLQNRKAQRQKAIEDLAWTMLNSIEFIFNH